MTKNPYVLLILATLFWGGNFVLGKAVSGSIPPLTLSYMRWVLAVILFLPFGWTEVKEHKETLFKNWQTFMLLGVTGVLGFNMCVYLSVQYTTATNASLINSFAPVVITLLSIIFLKERLTGTQGIGIFISLIGVIWIITRGQIQKLLNLSFNTGDLIMLVAVGLWGVYNIILKKKSGVGPQKVIFVGSIVAGLIGTLPLIIFENLQLGLGWISNLTTGHYLSIIYFGIFPTIISYQFFNKAVLEIGPSKASIFSNLVVVFATIFGIIFLGERILPAHLIGGVLIIMGVLMTTRRAKVARVEQHS